MPNNAFKVSITSLLMGIIRRLRVFLASRNLFHNWLSAGIKYYLSSHGLFHANNIEIICKDGFRSLIPVKIYGIIINDYYDGYITRYDCKRNTITYMNNVRLPVEEFEKSSTIDLAVKNGWAYDVAGKYWSKNGIKFRHMHWTILEVFEFGNYEGIDVNGKVVIDVGAFVGDTAIYFALKGAKSIIAIEPLPANYEELLDNVNLNGMRNKINVINAALSSKHGAVKVPRNVPVSIRGSSIDMYKKHGIGKLIDIKSITLSDLI